MQEHLPKIVGSRDGKAGFLGTVGVRFIIDGLETGKRFSLVEHPFSPRALAAPLHRHSREDEYTFVIEGTIGALLGDSVVVGKPGDLIFKPRNQWHTFWNAGDTPARMVEIISPAGFEEFFDKIVDAGGINKMSGAAVDALCSEYGLEMRLDSIPDLVKRFDVRFPGEWYTF